MTETFVERLAETRVLCVGDIMLDRYLSGAVERISPEAPVPVLRVDTERVTLGGVGNVVVNAASLGASVICVALVGDDRAGKEISDLLADTARCEAQLVTGDQLSSTVKTRCIGGHQQMIRIDRDPSRLPVVSEHDALLAKVETALPRADVVLISDYGKGAVTSDVAGRLIEAARRAEKPVIVDPKGPNYAGYSHATLITPNLKELAEASGTTLRNEVAVESAARALRQRYSFGAVLVTMSDKGMLLIDERNECHRIATTAQEVFDVSGAGDTVVAVMGCALAARMSLQEATTLANQAAGLVVAKLGTASVSAGELDKAMHGPALSALDLKLAVDSSLPDLLRNWREAGHVIGFTNGCFDLIHPGHVALLANARRLCDRLIVGLNSDASVRRLKGPARPIQNETARATVLASMSDVDALVVFDEETPTDLIERIRPDVLIKGADYKREEVIGGDFVTRHGGRVELVALVEGESTSQLVESSRRS